MKDKLNFQWLAGAIVSIASASRAGPDRERCPRRTPFKNKGLARSRGSTWLLSGDAMVLKDARTAKSLAVQWKSAQEQQRALESGNQNPQVFIDNYRQQIAWLDQRISAYDQELANLGPVGGSQVANVYHNMLVQERNGLVTEQRRLSTLIGSIADQRGQFQELKQQFNVRGCGDCKNRPCRPSATSGNRSTKSQPSTQNSPRMRRCRRPSKIFP